jgi:hypothetical protein
MCLGVCDYSQENVMNLHGSFNSAFVVNQPKKIITINTKQTKYLRVFLKEGILEEKAIFTYTVLHPLIRIWPLANFLGVHHPGPSLCKAAIGLNL